MRALAAVTLIAFASCGPDERADPVPIARYRSGLAMSAAGGCSTSIAIGLRNQLVEELNCIQPNLMVDFTGSHTNLYSGVNPWLAAGASTALRSATTARNDFITISSAYRTVAEQYLLYKWWQAGQCGIQLASTPGASNHQSGRAIDTPNHAYWRTALTNAGWTWLGSSDTVHFDHFASANVASKSVLAFQRLWNKNNASKLVEDGVWGPASNAAMASSPTSGFANHGCAPVTPTTGRLSGTITDAAGGAALPGVVVSAGGQTVTTGANGAFELTLGAGTFTVAASKDGYSPGSVTRAVQLGGTVSASMTLTRVATEGALRGVVRANGAPLEGVLVTAGPQMKTTAADGAFDFTLAAGPVSLVASKPAFVTQAQSVVVTAGAAVEVNVELRPSGEDLPPVVTLVSPASGLTSDLADVVITGTATDDYTSLREVSVVHNGGAPRAVQVLNGRFELPLRLLAGENVVDVTAVDSSSQPGSVAWRGSFRAGFDGLVHRYDDLAAVIGGAQLSLYEPDSDTLVGEARSDGDGRFSLVASVSGVARLHVERDGMTTRELLVTVSATERTALDLGLTPGDAPALRVIEPEFDSVHETEEVRISGVVSGLEVASVTVNGAPATLLGSGFVITVPLPQGRTVFELVAENGLGMSVRRELVVRRPMEGVQGGCSSVPGGALLALVAVLLTRRRRFIPR